MKKLTLITLLSIIAFSCKKESDPIIFGYEYFPVEKGHYVVYDVLDIFHDVALEPAHDSSRYQIKEVVGEAYLDNEGEESHKVKRFIRNSSADEWVLKDVWAKKRTTKTAELVEENDRMIKMIFAIAYDRSWDCNALNNEDEQTCYYENIYEEYDLNGTVYDSTVIVEKEDFTSFIDFKRKYEIYANGVGKIYSVFKDLEIDNFDTTDIVKGNEIYYSAIDYGIE